MWRECFFGFPQEDQHFANVVAGLEGPLETGEDGRATLEIMFAAYESAGTGRRVELPFTPPGARDERRGKNSIELWRP